MPTVLITGANRGIGLEFATQYSKDGWHVIATARQSSDELDSLDVRVEPLELSDLDSVASFGGRLEGPPGLVVAQAGPMGPPERHTRDQAPALAGHAAGTSA